MPKTDTLEQLKPLILKNNQIDEDLFSQYDVKRGLRNKDGSGVIAGLTRVASVVGAKSVDFHQVPMHGELKYRGVDIFALLDQLLGDQPFMFEKATFLLLTGKLPDAKELKQIKDYIVSQRELPDFVLEHVIKGIPGTDLMNKLQTAICALYAADSDPDSMDPFENVLKSLSIIAKLPAVIAYSYLCTFKKKPKLVKAPDHYSQAQAFLYLLHEGAEVTEIESNILDLCLFLHAEHGGGNNSTFAARVVTSTNSDIYSSLAAGVGSLKGPLHGAANQAVVKMVENIKSNVKKWDDRAELDSYLERIVNKEVNDKSGKIYGMGHAVYTKSDPRAIILKKEAQKLAELKNRTAELQLYLAIEEDGPEIFNRIKKSDKVIAPNVDFFSGFVYDCLGIPSQVYAPIFALARSAGWCAHRIEEMISGKRIIRPGYKYIPIA